MMRMLARRAITRLKPATIRFDEAIPVVILGLAVNVVPAWLLSTWESGHGHDHGGH